MEEYTNTNMSLAIIDTIDMSMVTNTLNKIAQFQALVKGTLHEKHDYGIIPGTPKPTLLKPGAEKINMLMGISSRFEIMEKTEDYINGFFTYNIRCTLHKNGVDIVEGVGNCNSREKKYISQDACSIANTILKMAKKRAYLDATLSIAALSDIFNQDLDDIDLTIDSPNPAATNEANKGKSPCDQVVTFGKNKGKTLGELYKNDRGYFDWLLNNNDKMRPFCEQILEAQKAKSNAAATVDADGVIDVTPEGKAITDGQNKAIHAIAKKISMDDESLHAYIAMTYEKGSITELTFDQAGDLITYLQSIEQGA